MPSWGKETPMITTSTRLHLRARKYHGVQNDDGHTFLLRALNSNYRHRIVRPENQDVLQRQICWNIGRESLITDTASPSNSGKDGKTLKKARDFLRTEGNQECPQYCWGFHDQLCLVNAEGHFRKEKVS